MSTSIEILFLVAGNTYGLVNIREGNIRRIEMLFFGKALVFAFVDRLRKNLSDLAMRAKIRRPTYCT